MTSSIFFGTPRVLSLTLANSAMPSSEKIPAIDLVFEQLAGLIDSHKKQGGILRVEFGNSGIFFEGFTDDSVLVQVLQEAIKEQTPEEAFLEILTLGSRVKDVIQTTATTQLLAKSVEDVQIGLKSLEEGHRDFLIELMEEISDEESNSDINLIRRLKDWSVEFDRKLALEFDSNNSSGVINKIKQAVDSYIAERESAVANLLSLEASSDPLSPRPLKSVYDKTQDILDKLIERDAKKSASRTNSKKGNDFEEAVYNIIQAMSDEYGDVSDNPGQQKAIGADGNDEGDITVEYRFDLISNVSGKLVIEAKHHGAPKSKPKLLEELEKGVSNREADYGILVTNESGYKLTGGFPFWEDWGNRRAILVLEDDFENLSEDKIRFAYLLAKARIRDIQANLDSETLEMVGEQISTIKTSFERIKQIKGVHTTAVGALGEMLNHISYLEINVGQKLKELHDQITKSPDSSEET